MRSGTAGAAGVPGLVEPRARWWGLLSWSVAPTSRFGWCFTASSTKADRQSEQHIWHPAHALLSAAYVSAAPPDRFFRVRMFSAPPVRDPAVEHGGRPVGGDRGRDLLRRAVGDDPVPAGHDDEIGPSLNAAGRSVPLILVAQCFSWHVVLTTNHRPRRRKSIWADTFFIVGIGLCRLVPEFDGAVRLVLAVAILGIAGYLAFLMTIDVPMYLSRWRATVADGSKLLRPLEGLRDVCTRWVVTHDLREWKDEIAWMSLYFSVAVWASLARCVCCSLEDQLPRYRVDATVASWSSEAVVGEHRP